MIVQNRPIAFEYRAFGTYRYILALLVMLQHFSANTSPAYFSDALIGYELGSLAVYAFFALSGFVIIEAADTIYQSKPMPFIANRMLRLYPHFLVALILSTIFHYAFIRMGTLRIEHKIVKYDAVYFAFKNLFMNTLSIFPFLDRFSSINFVTVSWALRIEIAFYAVVFIGLYMSRKQVLGYGSLGRHCTYVLILLLPVFVLSVLRKAPAMFGFLPYFSYGAGLYYMLKKSKTASLIVMLSIAGMFWHFWSLPPNHPQIGYERYVFSQTVILFFMLALIPLLMRVKISGKAKSIDKELGNYTYPLYMYHYIVLIIVASVLSDYAWETFFIGVASCIIISTLFAKLLDAKINQLRNFVRGVSL